MCDLREPKQNAFDNACYAFADSENMEQVAKQCGINPTMLRNKLNPEQPHKLTVGNLTAITEASGNYCIINSTHASDLSRLALGCGGEIRINGNIYFRGIRQILGLHFCGPFFIG